MERWRRYRQPQIYHDSQPAPPRRRRLSRPARWIGGGVLGLAAAVWLVLASPLFRVTSVKSEGELTPPLVDYVGGLVGSNLWRLSERRLTEELRAREPTVASVRLARGLPNEIRVRVSRRQPALLWQIGETVWAVDLGGVAFAPDATLASQLPRIRDGRHPTVIPGEKLLPPDFVAYVGQVYAELPARIGGSLTDGEIAEHLYSLRVGTEWGWSIWLDTRRPLAGQAANLGLVLRDWRDRIHEYVDLRSEGWGYVK